MKPLKYERKDHSIKNVDTGEIEHFKSINAAKRESRKLQKATDGAIGRGSLRVVDKLSVKRGAS